MAGLSASSFHELVSTIIDPLGEDIRGHQITGASIRANRGLSGQIRLGWTTTPRAQLSSSYSEVRPRDGMFFRRGNLNVRTSVNLPWTTVSAA